MPQLAKFAYQVDGDPEQREWEDPCFPCSDEDVALRIVEHVERETGKTPEVIHLCWHDQPDRWSRVEVAEARAAEQALWNRD